MSQPSSQDSTDTQEIYSQGSFEEIWDSLGRSFSNPEKMIQGVMTDVIPFTVEYKDQLDPDNIEVSYEERSLKGSQPVSGSLSQQFSDWLKTSPTTNGITPENEKLHETLHEKLHEPAQLPPILPNTRYPGPFNFSIDFEPNTEPITKATPWVYVAEREKLFVKMQCVCPILFKIIGNPPPGSGVRGILMYKRPEHYKDIVLRCPNHKNSSKDDHPYQDHVMKCGNASTIYECCPKTGRLSLFLPLSAVDRVAGECYFKELFKFTCFNSCVGGMNRRPTCLLFSLECGEMIYGRAVMEVRICASPGRDSTEKEISNNQKNSKNTDKRSEPISTTDVPTPMPLPTTNSPGSSPTYPPRASVLMSASKDPSSAPEPFQFPTVQSQLSRKRRKFLVFLQCLQT
ncbi:cellular tumor antigen p53-like isoform X5 [Paramuricea clavata]|nr:cellular tumor antigen p53-like isoform X5 [Paramuricea clavata]